jgi:hypothetical protein
MYGTLQALWDYKPDAGYVWKGVATSISVPISGSFTNNVLDGVTITDMYYEGSGTNYQTVIVANREVPQNAWGKVSFLNAQGATVSTTSASATYQVLSGSTFWTWQGIQIIFQGSQGTSTNFTFTNMF